MKWHNILNSSVRKLLAFFIGTSLGMLINMIGASP